jgi:hypothetical protein
MPGPVARSIAISIGGLDGATRTNAFELGSGGCCFLCPQPVAAGETIDHTIRVAVDSVTVRAQCEVRWYCATDRWAGVEFCYVEPASRNWLVERIESGTIRSFIPGFCANKAQGNFPGRPREFAPATVT